MSKMTLKEYFNIKARMAKIDKYGCCISCTTCPLSSTNNKRNCGCRTFETTYLDEAIVILEKWNEEHPVITNLKHYAEELRKLGFKVDEKSLPLRCPIPRSTHYSWTGKSNCDKGGCTECQKWWDEEYVPSAQ